jgi:glutaryl-CoA dehydrogenase
VAWSAVGHATACYETAVQYAAQRVQFGRPLAASQIVQERLARMRSELATMQLMAVQMTRLEAAGDLVPAQASLAKYTCTRTARRIASTARDLLGGNGILLENRVARHFADIEAIHTYEGTETVQALIIGRDITGISAFAG